MLGNCIFLYEVKLPKLDRGLFIAHEGLGKKGKTEEKKRSAKDFQIKMFNLNLLKQKGHIT